MKKGFTLVEMLAIIVLLGLLVTLIILKVRPAIDESRESVSEASANTLVSTFENYYFEAKLKGVFEGCSYDFTSNINSCSGLSFTGEKPTGGILTLNVDGSINGNLIFDQYEYDIIDNKVYKNNE